VQVTVFAPDNDAFARALVALNTTAAAFLAPSNAGLVTHILQYHIVDFKALSTDLKMGDTAVNTLSEWCFHACEREITWDRDPEACRPALWRRLERCMQVHAGASASSCAIDALAGRSMHGDSYQLLAQSVS